jgi:hypothetical protein
MVRAVFPARGRSRLVRGVLDHQVPPVRFPTARESPWRSGVPGDDPPIEGGCGVERQALLRPPRPPGRPPLADLLRRHPVEPGHAHPVRRQHPRPRPGRVQQPAVPGLQGQHRLEHLGVQPGGRLQLDLALGDPAARHRRRPGPDRLPRPRRHPRTAHGRAPRQRPAKAARI